MVPRWLRWLLAASFGVAVSPAWALEQGEKPNVLFIVVDDLNDWVGVMGGHPHAKTPNIDRLAMQGMLFANAHCSAPLCNPSRASFMTGFLPTTSGVHGNQQDWRASPFLKGKPTLPEFFKRHGYWTGGCGKLFHANHGGESAALNGGHGGLRGFNHPESWTERFPSKDRQLAKPAVLPGQNYNGLDIWHWDWGLIDVPDEQTADGRAVAWATDQLGRKHDKPFFLAVGIYKPHGPWYVPREYFDRHPIDQIVLPTVKQSDLDDVPEIAKRYLKNYSSNLHAQILDNNLYHAAVQAYLANISFADVMVGRVLDALDASPYAENTIVCLFSDHGWHLGEKQKWHKSTNWEEATRVPLILRAPGTTKPGTSTTRPASLVDVYPTLIELCGLPKRDDLDGVSLVPQLNDPNAPRARPAITTRAGRNHSVRSERWRYIRYADGSEELYDHDNDPNEWSNLADRVEHAAVKKELAHWLPTTVNVVEARPEPGTVEPGFRPLFNGYDLTSWEGDPDRWSVRDHTIVGRTTAEAPLPHNTFLIWRGGMPDDFELRLQFRVTGTENWANSGVQYRSKERPEFGKWVLGGYQADIDLSKKYIGILYEEKGRGILALRGEKVELNSPAAGIAARKRPPVARKVTGSVGDSDKIAAQIRSGKWNDYTIIARGHHLVHKINGRVTVDVTDGDAANRAAKGLLGLQLHRGTPMTIEFRNVRLRDLPSAMPRINDDSRHTGTDQRSARSIPADDNTVTWNFEDGQDGWTAAHDCRLSAAGGILGVTCTGSDPFLTTRTNAPAGWKELTIRARFRGRKNGQIFWTTEESPNTSEALSTRFTMRTVRGKWNEFKVYFRPKAALTGIRIDPQDRVGRLEIDSITLSNREPPVESATHPAGFEIAAGFRAELLYSVPQHDQGSWVSLTVDPKGRLMTCDQYGGLYRVSLPPVNAPGDTIHIEPAGVQIGGAQGMVWAFDSLYVVVNGAQAQGPGLYRVRDTDGDDRLDRVDLLKKLPTIRVGVEHGPHGVVVAPDGKSLVVIAGNMTRLPEGIKKPSRHQNWDEDLLLPRGPASNGHASGLMAPGGWACRTDPDGKSWELLCAGFRNPYDLAFHRHGEAFTYDADMEMDVGTPWYRPTRVCHIVSGGEFGWRFGTGKWRSYYPDSLPPVVDVGLGSPTGVVFGYGARFPARYQQALFICDWTNGAMYAVHLEPNGASYSGRLERFLSGTPLPLTDLVINPLDGAMYFTIGGRRTQSGLYRVTYHGPDSTAPITDREEHFVAAESRQTRRKLESFHGAANPAAVDEAWPYLASDDRHLRFAARVAVEHQPIEHWIDRAFAETRPDAVIQSMLAITRSGNAGKRPLVLKSLARLCWPDLSRRQRADLLRTYALTISRLGRPSEETVARIAGELEKQFPSDDTAVNHELCRLLVALESTSVVRKSLPLLAKANTQEDRLTYLQFLSHANGGWRPDLRRQYFNWLNRAESAASIGDYVGGGHLQTYIRAFRDTAAVKLTQEEQTSLDELLHAKIASVAPSGSPTPRKFVRNWTIEDLLPRTSEIGAGRSFSQGKEMFTVANCIQCHRFNNVGGILGPDITNAAKRYGRPVLLREILDPSKQISDQFQTHVIVTTDGEIFEGRILAEQDGVMTMATNPVRPSARVQIPIANVEQKRLSQNSMMPKDLLNTLDFEEILDLLAYIESGGNSRYAAFDRAASAGRGR